MWTFSKGLICEPGFTYGLIELHQEPVFTEGARLM